MKKIVLLFLSAIFILSSICIVISRILVPIIKNKKIQSQITTIDYTKLKLDTNLSDEGQKEIIKIEGTDANKVKIYVGEYIKYINNGDFAQAYNMLASNFKKINFETQSEFETYWKDKYPSHCIIKYISVERAGNAIMAKLQLKDLYNTKEPISQMFSLVKENNEYKISFGIGENVDE